MKYNDWSYILKEVILLKKQSGALRLLKNLIYALIIPVGMWAVFAIASGGRTASAIMLITTLRQCVMPSIICYGLMLNMSVGMMNFAAGGMMLCACIVGGNLAKAAGMGIPGLVFFCVLICLIEGVIVGALYRVMHVPSIVLTIGMMLLWEALPKVFYTEGLNLTADYTYLTRSPYCFFVLAVCLIAFYVIYNKTAFGHNLRAIGNNQAIANSVGLDSDKIKFLSYVLGAAFLGIGAVLYASSNGEIRNVSSLGSMSIMFDGFMGMFIAMFIAQFCDMSFAVVFGVFTMKMLSNGFVALGMSSTVRDIVQGGILLVLMIISANAGIFEKIKANKTFRQECNDLYLKSK